MSHTYDHDNNDNNETTIIFDTDICWILYCALRPSNIWYHDFAHRCIHNNIVRYKETSRTTNDNYIDSYINNNENDTNNCIACTC